MQTLYDTMVNKIGVFRNASKSVLLLPASVPSDTKALKLFPSFTYDGIHLMGRPIGTDAYVKAKCQNKSEAVLRRARIIAAFGQQSLCIALKLLGSSATSGMDHIARTVPPRLLADTAVRFDTEIFEAAVDILSPTGAIYPWTEQSCLERAKRIAHLPYRSGGSNLIQLAQKSPVFPSDLRRPPHFRAEG
jgi:hypothetical protein